MESRVDHVGGTARPTSAELASNFGACVQPHFGAMRRVAAVTAPGLDPDDVVQEALLRAWHKRATYRPDRGEFRGWLLAVTADRARRMRQRAGPRVLANDVDRIAGAPDESSLALRDAVQALSARQREAVLLFYYADLPVREVAAAMRCAEGTVKSTLSDARAHLQRALGETRG